MMWNHFLFLYFFSLQNNCLLFSFASSVNSPNFRIILVHSQLHFLTEFWSEFVIFWRILKTSSLRKFINFSYWLKFGFLIGILIKILEEFHKNSAVSYNCISNQNSARNSWRTVIWIFDFLKNSDEISSPEIYQFFYR